MLFNHFVWTAADEEKRELHSGVYTSLVDDLDLVDEYVHKCVPNVKDGTLSIVRPIPTGLIPGAVGIGSRREANRIRKSRVERLLGRPEYRGYKAV